MEHLPHKRTLYSSFLEDIPKELLDIRHMDGPAADRDPEEEERFARQQLAKLFKMTE